MPPAANLQDALTDAELVELRDTLLERVGRFRSRGVIVDVTVLDVLDSFACRMFREILVHLRGRAEPRPDYAR